MRTPSDMKPGSVFNTNNSGQIKIIQYNDWLSVDVLFIKSGYTASVRAGDIRKGKVKDVMHPSVCGVGFIGNGPYTPISNGVKAASYTKWLSMMYRCYDDKYHKQYPTYQSCEVCEEWQNYQNFAAWCHENYPEGFADLHLDKDILVDGNKVYSPETCIFVSATENIVKSSAKEYIFRSPNGEVFSFSNLKEFCRNNSLVAQCMGKVFSGERKHHKGWTAEVHAT